MEDGLLSESSINNIVDLVVQYGMSVLGAILVIIVGWIASRWAHRITSRALGKRDKVDQTLVKFFANMARWLVLIVAIMAALEMFGVKTTSLVAILGAAGLAVGLAFQGTLSNFASGVMLLLFRPFKVGDAVRTAGETGLIDEIGLFTTSMDTFDNRRIVIPNSAIFGSVIETITYHDTRRVDVPVGTDYSADLDRVRSVLEGAAEHVTPRLDEPPHQILLKELGGSSIDWEVRVWTKTSDFWRTRQSIVREVKKHLDAAEIGIPFPQMDVHLDGELTRTPST